MQCPGCGARLAVDPGKVTGDCPFCLSALVLADQTGEGLRFPAGIVPFRINADQARDAILQAGAGSQTLPPGFTPDLTGKAALRGIYLATFVFDLQVRAQISVRARHGLLVGDPQSTQIERWVENVVVPACDTLGPFGSLPSWAASQRGMDGMVQYDRRLLAGYDALLPTLTVEQSLDRAAPEIQKHIDLLAFTDLDPLDRRPDRTVSNFQRAAVRARLVFLPVWLGEYQHQGQSFRVWADGSTGAARIETPIPGDIASITKAGDIGLYLSAGLVTLFIAGSLIAAGIHVFG